MSIAEGIGSPWSSLPIFVSQSGRRWWIYCVWILTKSLPAWCLEGESSLDLLTPFPLDGHGHLFPFETPTD